MTRNLAPAQKAASHNRFAYDQCCSNGEQQTVLPVAAGVRGVTMWLKVLFAGSNYIVYLRQRCYYDVSFSKRMCFSALRLGYLHMCGHQLQWRDVLECLPGGQR